MSEIDKATKRLNDAADKATITTDFFDELTTAGNQSDVTNPNNNKTVPSVSKQVIQVYEEGGLNPDAISRQNQQLIRNLGEWQSGLTFEKKGDYATFNDQAIITNDDTPLPYTTQGTDPTVAPDSGNVVPFAEVQSTDVELVYNTVSDLKLSDVPANQMVKTRGYHAAGDGGGASYIIRQGISADEYINHTLSNGNVAELVIDGELYAPQAGLVSDYNTSVKDKPSMSDVLDAIASFVSPNYIYGVRRPYAKSQRVNLGDKPFRITRPFYQPAFTEFYQSVVPNFAWDGISADSTDETFIYCDWEGGEKDCAWNFAGWWLEDSGTASAGDRLNQFKKLIGSADYNSGRISLTYGCECRLSLFTDKFIGASLGVFAATASRYDIQSLGFLHPVVSASCWSGEGRVNALSYHTGGFFYNCNKWEMSGYVNSTENPGAPALSNASAPEGWYEHPVHNPPEYAYLTTGMYTAYCNGFNTNITTEHWERARYGENSTGIFEVAPYIEGISVLGIHCVNSEYVWSGGVRSMTQDSVSLTRPSGKSHIMIDMLAVSGSGIQEVFSGTTDPTYSTSGVTVNVRDASQCVYTYSDNVVYTFANSSVDSIYVSNAGSDENEGVNENYPVKTVDVAVSRAIRHEVNVIKVDSTQPVSFSSYSDLKDNKFVFKSYNGGNAKIVPKESGNAIVGFRLRGNNTILFDGVDLQITPSVSPAPSASSLIRMDGGVLSLTITASSVTTSNGGGLISSGSNRTSGIINFSENNSSFSGVIGVTPSNPYGGTKVLISSFEDLSSQFESSYTLI